MWTRSLLKQNGKVAFHRNYWTCVAVCLIAGFLGVSLGGEVQFDFNVNGESTNTVSSDFGYQMPVWFAVVIVAIALATVVMVLAFTTLVSNVATVGCNRYFLENREHKTGIGQLFYAFQGGRYGSTVWVMFLRELFIFGWTLLFIIPGIVKSYSYMLVPYILAENTYIDRKRVFELSSKMMDGHKMEAFVLGLSFIGWQILSAFTGGLLGIFYTTPYMQATFAEFYSALKAEALKKGILMEGELPGVGTLEA